MTHISQLVGLPPVMLPAYISITNEKGGVAKTTTTINLAWALAGSSIKGHPCKVLIVDLDTQGHCASMLGIKPAPDVFEFFISRRSEPEPNILPTDNAHLDILTGNNDTATLATVYAANNTPVDEIVERMQLLGREYDVIIFDAPESSGKLRQATIAIASIVILPTKPEGLSLTGIQPIIDTMPDKEIIVLPTLTMPNRVHKGYLTASAEWWSNQVIHTTPPHCDPPEILNIPHRAEMLSAAEEHTPIVKYKPLNAAALAYKYLAEYIRVLWGETFRI